MDEFATLTIKERQCRMNREDLIRLLRVNSIDINDYGTGKAKSLDDLLDEIQTGEAEVSQRVVREISVVAINVRFPRDGGTYYRLVEIEQRWNDGRTRERTYLTTSLSEKMHRNESIEAATSRALREELQVNNYFIPGETTTSTEVKESPSFPGILTIYKLHKVDVVLCKADYRPEGYQETEGDLTTYFQWKEE